MLNRVSARDYGRALLDLMIPRTCAVCGCCLSMHERHICLGCLADMPRTFFSNVRNNQMAQKFNALIQRDLDDTGESAPFSYATALFFYRTSTGYSRITQRLKYHSDISSGKFFSKMLLSQMKASPLFSDIDLVIPVPLHWTRKWSRGYNQAEIIARVIASGLGAEMRADVLYRVRRTRTQTKMSVSEKARNVSGAFAIRKSFRAKPCRHILIVDDVFTTGATLHSCWQALRRVFPPEVRISIATLGCVGS